MDNMVRAIAHDTIKNDVDYSASLYGSCYSPLIYNASLYGLCYCPCTIPRLCTWLLSSILFTAHLTRNG